MLKKKVFILTAIFTLLISICTLGFDSNPHILSAERPIGTEFDEAFDEHDRGRWSMAGVWSNGDMFNATWYPEQVTFSDGQMVLQIDREANENASPPFRSGELRTNDFYHYGLFEVSMKPAKSTGTVSSFFTYTGPWDWDGDPWDEIDIEFLGKDTTRVQFNYFTNGVGGNEHYHDLGFDAADDFNTYAFEWRPDSIQWYVNGELVHTATENIPQTPQKIMMNLWPGIGVDGWTGAFNEEDIPVTTYYDWVRYTPFEEYETTQPDTPANEENDNVETPGDDEQPVGEEEHEVEQNIGNETEEVEDNQTETNLPIIIGIALIILLTVGILFYISRKKK